MPFLFDSADVWLKHCIMPPNNGKVSHRRAADKYYPLFLKGKERYGKNIFSVLIYTRVNPKWQELNIFSSKNNIRTYSVSASTVLFLWIWIGMIGECLGLHYCLQIETCKIKNNQKQYCTKASVQYIFMYQHKCSSYTQNKPQCITKVTSKLWPFVLSGCNNMRKTCYPKRWRPNQLQQRGGQTSTTLKWLLHHPHGCSTGLHSSSS